jgi:hypothetical protein
MNELPSLEFIRGAHTERDRIINLIERQICFDALADEDGRCSHHGGKCYELRGLINSLIRGEGRALFNG